MKYLLKPLPGEKLLRDFICDMRYRRWQTSYQTKFITITDSMIGYCVRMFPIPNKRSNGKDDFQYHADCILPKAQLASYGYNQIDNLAYVGSLRDRFQKGLGGEVKFDKNNDDKFFDANRAFLSRCLTSFLIFSVSWIQAEKFRRFWHQPPQKYNRFSNNCSSIPYAALYEAGIFPKSLVSPITPQRLL